MSTTKYWAAAAVLSPCTLHSGFRGVTNFPNRHVGCTYSFIQLPICVYTSLPSSTDASIYPCSRYVFIYLSVCCFHQRLSILMRVSSFLPHPVIANPTKVHLNSHYKSSVPLSPFPLCFLFPSVSSLLPQGPPLHLMCRLWRRAVKCNVRYVVYDSDTRNTVNNVR